jgi:uridine phosphorylase
LEYPLSELVLSDTGQVYHLGLHPENIAHKIILVGDQDRVGLISQFFDTVEHQSKHREFVCHTGTYKNKRISALSTGIGTDNIDIVINELDALVNIDLKNRTNKSEQTALEIIRIGTCGILQKEIPIHSWIVSTHAFGLDNVAHFYNIQFSKEELEMEKKLTKHLGLPEKIQPYFIQSSPKLTERISSSKTYNGITVTSSGFYGPQGRQLRLQNKIKDLQLKFGQFESESKVLNFEMESSALFALGRELGHQCATICLGVANRPSMAFSKGYHKEMEELIKYILERV